MCVKCNQIEAQENENLAHCTLLAPDYKDGLNIPSIDIACEKLLKPARSTYCEVVACVVVAKCITLTSALSNLIWPSGIEWLQSEQSYWLNKKFVFNIEF